jgi:WD40 repeat protein
MDKFIKSNIPNFNEKVILSTSKEDKRLLLWDDTNRCIIYTYEDSNVKTFVPNNKLLVIGQELYSEYILALQENKSLITIWKTNVTESAIRSVPIDERITCTSLTNNNKLLFLGTETGNIFISELFTGNIFGLQVSSEKLLAIKPLLRHSSYILCVCKDYIKSFLLEKYLYLI